MAASTNSRCSVSVDVSDNTGFDSELDSTTEESELDQEKRTVVSLLDRLKSPTSVRPRKTKTNDPPGGKPSASERESLKGELPAYLARVNSLHEEFDPLDWWKNNSSVLPYWSIIAKKVMLIQPSSAAAKRVFSLLKASFGEQQEACLQDYIEASLMLQYNKR